MAINNGKANIEGGDDVMAINMKNDIWRNGVASAVMKYRKPMTVITNSVMVMAA